MNCSGVEITETGSYSHPSNGITMNHHHEYVPGGNEFYSYLNGLKISGKTPFSETEKEKSDKACTSIIGLTQNQVFNI